MRFWLVKIGLSLTVTFLGASSFAQDAAEVKSCRTVLAKTSFWSDPIKWIQENAPTLISRYKPVYESSDFDVRVIAWNPFKSVFSPQALEANIVNSLNHGIARFKELGFPTTSYAQVIVEAHPDAAGNLRNRWKRIRKSLPWTSRSVIKKLIPYERSKKSKSTPEGSPWVGTLCGGLTIPGEGLLREQFIGKVGRMGFQSRAKILFFPTMTEEFHWIDDPFVVAHELAHLTQNSHSFRSRTWMEARADYLAYVSTGIKVFRQPFTIDRLYVNPKGEVKTETLDIIRSVEAPVVSKRSEARPDHSAYHDNSQIFSSALFKAEAILGQKALLDFVKWMDAQVPADKSDLGLLRPRLDWVRYRHDNEMFLRQDIELSRVEVELELLRMGQLLRQWMLESNLPTDQIVSIEKILQEKEI